MQLFVKAEEISTLDVQPCDTVGSIKQRLTQVSVGAFGTFPREANRHRAPA